MNVICLEDQAFFELIDTVIQHIQGRQTETHEWKWVDKDTCMELLNIKSPTTLQKLRDEGQIRYTQPQPRIILYDKDSIAEYLENNAREPF